MDLSLADNVAVVTGASQGFGLAVTQALVQEGGYVVADQPVSVRRGKS